ncbi:MAG: leucine-rich repeat domain-containing protein [Clostridia bacterium]|nr:leucine-rich repeat domain-containing protein [Clostridia bacterium]
MKAKTKLIALIMSICLVCAVFAIGVFALKTANLKIGGDVNFTATGVEVQIKNAAVTGTKDANSNKDMATAGVINTTMTQIEVDNAFSTWKNLSLDFNENADDIVFSFDIVNTSENADNFVEIDYEYSFSVDNPNIDVFPETINPEDMKTEIDMFKKLNYMLAPKGEPEAADYQQFKLIFRVLDKELNVPDNTKLNLTISLKHTAPVESTNWSIQTEYPMEGQAALFGYNGSVPENGVLEFPAVVKHGGSNHIVTSIIGMPGFNADPDTTTTYFPTTAKEYVFHNSVLMIGGRIIDSPLITHINIPVSTYIVAGYAFYKSNISSVSMTNGLMSIGEQVFSSCAELNTIDFPRGIKSIEYKAFLNCTSLETLVFPDNITFVSHDAFTGCTNLKSIYFGDGLESVDGDPFKECPNISTLVFGAGVTSIAGFDDCNLETIKVDELNPVYDSRNNCNAVIETEYDSMLLACKTTVIPASVKSIDGAFYGVKGLEEINIPYGVEVIGFEAFSGCVNLTNVTIPSSVNKIDDYAFENCEKLANITIPNSVEYVGDCCFSNTAIYNNSANGLIVVDGWAVAYKTESEDAFTVTLNEDVKGIAAYLFYDSNLSAITMSNSLLYIGKGAFRYCDSLTSIVIPASVKRIGDYAFSDCEKLTSAEFKQISNWFVQDNVLEGATPTAIAESEFTPNASEQNAQLLTTKYQNKIWTRVA